MGLIVIGLGFLLAWFIHPPGEFGGIAFIIYSLGIGSIINFIFSVIGIVLGIKAWILTKSAHRKNRMALAGIVVGCVQFLILYFLVFSLFSNIGFKIF